MSNDRNLTWEIFNTKLVQLGEPVNVLQFIFPVFLQTERNIFTARLILSSEE